MPSDTITQVMNKYSLSGKYFVFLGGFDKRKNVSILLDAFAKLPLSSAPLVLAGEHKWDFRVVADRIKALGLSGERSE